MPTSSASESGILGDGVLGEFILGGGVVGNSPASASVLSLIGNVSVPTINNIAHYIGEDKTFQVKIFQADGITPANITNWTFSFTVHAYGDPSTIFYTKSTAGGTITILDPVNGLVQIVCSSADTLGFLANEYQFFLERIDIGNTFLTTIGLYTLRST